MKTLLIVFIILLRIITVLFFGLFAFIGIWAGADGAFPFIATLIYVIVGGGFCLLAVAPIRAIHESRRKTYLSVAITSIPFIALFILLVINIIVRYETLNLLVPKRGGYFLLMLPLCSLVPIILFLERWRYLLKSKKSM